MKKLIGKILCWWGSHDWEQKGKVGEWIEQRRCRRCGLFHDRDTLLNNDRYYTMSYYP